MSKLLINSHSSMNIKYGLDPAPTPLNNDTHNDNNLQDLLRRKRELEKNKSKFHLSEADCNLLLTKANEFYYKDKQVVVHEGQELPSVYRIKSGKVNIVKNGRSVSTISQGWFLGETMFLNGRTCVYDASLVANGPVTICELNLEFVKRLFDVDHILALKFYRTLAAKLSSVCYALKGHLLGACLASISQSPVLVPNSSFPFISVSQFNPNMTSSASSSSVGSASSSSSSSSSSSQTPTSPRLSPESPIPTASITAIAPPSMVVNAAKLSQCPNLPDSFLLEVINRNKRLTKRKSTTNLHAAFKVYGLEPNSKGLQGCSLKRKKITLNSESFGFKHKTSVEYAKIKNIVRTTEKSVTVIYQPFQAKTLFFKTPEDAEEFTGLALSLVDAVSREIKKSTTGSPISSPLLLTDKSSLSSSTSDVPSSPVSPSSPLPSTSVLASSSSISPPSTPVPDDDELKALLRSLATKRELKKGEYLVEEGDLYQRIYTLVDGVLVAMRQGHVFKEIKAGSVLGIPSLLHLRPCPTALRVESETATVLVLPAYKINEVGNANLPLASRLYKKAAAALQDQIEEILRSSHDVMVRMDSSIKESLRISVNLGGDSSSSSSSSPPPSPTSKSSPIQYTTLIPPASPRQ